MKGGQEVNGRASKVRSNITYADHFVQNDYMTETTHSKRKRKEK